MDIQEMLKIRCENGFHKYFPMFFENKYSEMFGPWSETTPEEDEDENEATLYAVTIPEGVTGAANATANTAYSFTVGENYTLTSITVGETALTTDDYTVSESTYTIKAEKVTGAIVIAVAAN